MAKDGRFLNFKPSLSNEQWHLALSFVKGERSISGGPLYQPAGKRYYSCLTDIIPFISFPHD